MSNCQAPGTGTRRFCDKVAKSHVHRPSTEKKEAPAHDRGCVLLTRRYTPVRLK